MTILKEIATEFVGMFVGDAGLTIAILAVVAAAAAMTALGGTDPLFSGAVLLFGSLAVLVDSVRRAAR